MTAPTMNAPDLKRAGPGLLAAAYVAAALIVGIGVLGLGHTVIVAAVVVGVGLVTLAGTEWVIRSRRLGRAASISIQLSIVIGLVMAPLLVALVILGIAMFVSGKDAALVAVIVALSAVLGIAAAARLARSLSRDVGSIRDGLVAVSRGERDVQLSASSAAELAELAQRATAMIERLGHEESARAASEAAQRELVAHASHDLRTPVTSLRLLATAIDDDLVEGELRRDYTRRMLTHIEALSALIDDLFELSRLRAGDISWTVERVAVNDLVDEAVAAMAVEAAAKGVGVRAELPATLVTVRGNPDKLQRVLFNLIQNAIRHSPSQETVVVRAETLAETIEVEVQDRGAGIPEHERPLIFEAFYRGLRDAPVAGDGAGLGLAVARAIVEAHGGEIWIPDAACGTRVRFSVPIAGAAN